MSLASESKLFILKDRAEKLAQVRRFFDERGVLEVDVPLLRRVAPVDLHIDLINATALGHPAYLSSSPEYGMKRLLSEGMKDIYQLSHVFRDGEKGAFHLPEFMMVEWYRLGFSMKEMIDETLSLCQLFLDEKRVESIPYKKAFRDLSNKDPEKVSERDYTFAFEVQPHLGKKGFTVIHDFLPEDAALSRMEMVDGEKVGRRFEIFYQGVELANGYEELTDAKEQRRRLVNANEERKALGKETYPLDEHFLNALERGIPDCSGVAVGFDRLMMLRHKLSDISEGVSFPWE